MEYTYENAVAKTVRFWSEKSFKTKMNKNNGDDTGNSDLGSALMNLVTSKEQKNITIEKIKAFEKKLTELLMNSDPWDRILAVDYAPDSRLREAAQHAGLSELCFPWKTFTRINRDNTVNASYQYRGELVEL